MPLPYTFISGNVAKSSEVNDNFNFIMDILGQLSTPDRIQPLGEFMMGPRRTVLLTANQDTGGAQGNFFQVSWNADYNRQNTTWVFQRILPNAGASALRVGTNGIEFLTTSAKTGNLNSQMNKPWGLTATTGEDYMYFADAWHMQNVDTTATSLQHYRLTTVMLENPAPIYSNTWVSKGTDIRKATNYGIPRHAKAIVVTAHVTAANYSGAGMHFYQHRHSASIGANLYRGFVAHAPITGTGLGMRTGAQGIVPLGRGDFQSEFVIKRTSAFELANVYIVGYLT